MYVPRNNPNNGISSIVKPSTERPVPDVNNGERPEPAVCYPAEEAFLNKILSEIDPFLQKMDLEGALKAIRSHKDEFKDMPMSMESVEELVTVHFEYMRVLIDIDILIDHGEFEEALKLVDDKADLIRSVDHDPEAIKESIKDFDKLFDLLLEAEDLISEGKEDKAKKLFRENRQLLFRLDMTPEMLIESVCPDPAPQNTD